MLASFLLVISTVALGPADAKVNAEELKRFQGTWQTVSFEKATGKVPAEEIQLLAVVVKEDRWTFKLRNGKEGVARIVLLDPNAKPARISLEIGGSTFHGIYRFEGDLLMANVRDAGDPAPTEFRPGESKTGGVMTYRRKAAKD